MQNLGKSFFVLCLVACLSVFLTVYSTKSGGQLLSVEHLDYVSPSESKFQREWDSLSDSERNAIHEKATWMARVMLSEDKRKEPWVMMASIIVNRKEMEFRGKSTIWGVIHDKHQFSAVGSENWSRYKNLTIDSRNQHFKEAYEIARKVLVMGVPKRYKGVTHAYYPETMLVVYGNNREYPAWDSPDNPMDNRNEVDGWVYGSP